MTDLQDKPTVLLIPQWARSISLTYRGCAGGGGGQQGVAYFNLPPASGAGAGGGGGELNQPIPVQYISDPAEEAWHASPDGLLAGAKERRELAARLIAEADDMEARANAE